MPRSVFASILFIVQFSALAQGEPLDQACPVDPERYVIFTAVHGRFPYTKEKLDTHATEPGEVERAECMLRSFHRRCEHEDLALRDSLRRTSKWSVTCNFVMVNLDNAYRQYQAGRNGKGDRLLFVNGLCRSNGEQWKQGWWLVEDGGPCYWQAVVNLTQGRIEMLLVNGAS